MKYPLLLVFIGFSLLAKTQSIGLLQTGTADAETTAALMFLNNVEHYQASPLPIGELKSSEQLQEFKLVWFHHSDTTLEALPRKARNALMEYVEGGGRLMLTLEAARALNDLMPGNTPLEVRHKKANDSGYGRKLGLHAFRSHPVFEGLHGGSYIFKPLHDTTLRIIGLFDDKAPAKGRVIAVDWDYIFLREQSKLMLEYQVGRGKVLVTGAYVCLGKPNIHAQHLRMFVLNCLRYLLGAESTEKARYWTYGPQQVIIDSLSGSQPLETHPANWPDPNNHGLLSRNSENQFWDVAGERMLVMGHENGGIDEIWAHPFMALREYHGTLLIGNESFDLRQLVPRVEVRPNAFTRIYRTSQFMLTETIIADATRAAAVVHYQYSGPDHARLKVAFGSNLRLMWPYSETVLKTLHACFDEGLNAFRLHAGNNEFNVLVGSNQKPEKTSLQAADPNAPAGDPVFEAQASFTFALHDKGALDVVVAADHRHPDSCLMSYTAVAENTAAFYLSNTQNDPYRHRLQIISPDPVFNEGYAWALRATQRFITHTPGLGTSLVAGIGTTQKGWDGGHPVNGRPGYAWYFGRDGQWSGMALLDYGDFESVKKVLEMYQRFQDLNGKIYHELSTSGIVHFDASDATPLYIVLAGRYLRHSGDVDFIRQSWDHLTRAISYCQSTDTDGDHLIENTNVGHGWVEGGGLFGSHASLYLSACWAEALSEAAYMASAINNDGQAAQWKQESERVTQIINHDFWNTETSFLNQGKYKDGSYHTEPSILPSIPIYFGQVEPAKAGPMLAPWAGSHYSTDWGCRIVSDQSGFYNPRGYHSGSVWPLFTGWVSLAEYSSGRAVQAYTHLLSNLLVYRHWGLGFIEEVLHGETYSPAGVCHHQCWSETMVLQPAIEGLLGIVPDAVQHAVEIAPQLPPHWDSIRVNNLRVGPHTLSLLMQRRPGSIRYTLRHQGPSSIRLLFDPRFEPGTRVTSTFASGVFENVRLSPFVPVEFYLEDEVTITYQVEGGIQIVPPRYSPEPGAASAGLRVINESFGDNTYTLLLEGMPGSTHLLELFVRDAAPLEAEGAKITGQKGNIYTIETTFAGTGSEYTTQQVSIGLTGK